MKKTTKTPAVREEKKVSSTQEMYKFTKKELEEKDSNEESKVDMGLKRMQQMESDSEMNWEGGQQEEEEQSESSQDDNTKYLYNLVANLKKTLCFF